MMPDLGILVRNRYESSLAQPSSIVIMNKIAVTLFLGCCVFVATGGMCDMMPTAMFDLPTVNGRWRIDLTNVDGRLHLVIENREILEYDQGNGIFQDIEETPAVTQSNGIMRFTMQATQAFAGFNNEEPTEFNIVGEGVIQEDGTVEIELTFTAIESGDEGVLEGVMTLIG